MHPPYNAFNPQFVMFSWVRGDEIAILSLSTHTLYKLSSDNVN